jgi:hypothetical protein
MARGTDPMNKFFGRKNSVFEAEVGFEEHGAINYELRITSYEL